MPERHGPSPSPHERRTHRDAPVPLGEVVDEWRRQVRDKLDDPATAPTTEYERGTLRCQVVALTEVDGMIGQHRREHPDAHDAGLPDRLRAEMDDLLRHNYARADTATDQVRAEWSQLDQERYKVLKKLINGLTDTGMEPRRRREILGLPEPAPDTMVLPVLAPRTGPASSPTMPPGRVPWWAGDTTTPAGSPTGTGRQPWWRGGSAAGGGSGTPAPTGTGPAAPAAPSTPPSRVRPRTGGAPTPPGGVPTPPTGTPRPPVGPPVAPASPDAGRTGPGAPRVRVTGHEARPGRGPETPVERRNRLDSLGNYFRDTAEAARLRYHNEDQEARSTGVADPDALDAAEQAAVGTAAVYRMYTDFLHAHPDGDSRDLMKSIVERYFALAERADRGDPLSPEEDAFREQAADLPFLVHPSGVPLPESVDESRDLLHAAQRRATQLAGQAARTTTARQGVAAASAPAAPPPPGPPSPDDPSTPRSPERQREDLAQLGNFFQIHAEWQRITHENTAAQEQGIGRRSRLTLGHAETTQLTLDMYREFVAAQPNGDARDVIASVQRRMELLSQRNHDGETLTGEQEAFLQYAPYVLDNTDEAGRPTDEIMARAAGALQRERLQEQQRINASAGATARTAGMPVGAPATPPPPRATSAPGSVAAGAPAAPPPPGPPSPDDPSTPRSPERTGNWTDLREQIVQLGTDRTIIVLDLPPGVLSDFEDGRPNSGGLSTVSEAGRPISNRRLESALIQSPVGDPLVEFVNEDGDVAPVPVTAAEVISFASARKEGYTTTKTVPKIFLGRQIGTREERVAVPENLNLVEDPGHGGEERPGVYFTYIYNPTPARSTDTYLNSKRDTGSFKEVNPDRGALASGVYSHRDGGHVYLQVLLPESVAQRLEQSLRAEPERVRELMTRMVAERGRIPGNIWEGTHGTPGMYNPSRPPWEKLPPEHKIFLRKPFKPGEPHDPNKRYKLTALP